ncbi:MAG: hypothetical protein WAU68_17375 [Vitreimonas sp.]
MSMYKELHYVASQSDETGFREMLRSMALTVAPERPGGERDLSDESVNKDRRRLLSFRPEEELKVSYTNPYPHYSEAVQPLLTWDVPYITGTVIVTGWLRHHAYMEKDGPEFVEIGAAFTAIKKWMKANWQPLNNFDFIGPGASSLINEHGFTWSCFDPNRTTFTIAHSDGTEEEVTHEEWMNSNRE